MQKKSGDFSMEEAKRLAETPAAQQLMTLLRKKDTAVLQQALNQAAEGNYSQAQQALSALLSDPEAAELIRQLGG